MEIIDISNFYRFDSVPSPLLVWNNIMEPILNIQFKDNYTEITRLNDNQLNPASSLVDHFHRLKFDDLISFYNKEQIKETINRKDFIKTKLNNIKIYVIVKSKVINNKKYFVILPINNFENLSSKSISRLYLHRDGVFEINANPEIYHKRTSPGERKFYLLDDLLNTQGAFDSQLETKIRNVPIETEEDILERKGLRGKLLGDSQEYYSLPEYENTEYLPEIDPNPELWRDDDKDSIWVQKYGIPKQDYEYDEAEIDNAMFSNSIKYFSGTEKFIYPIFETIEDAEKLLLTIFEDFLEPFKKKRLTIKQQDFLKLTKKEQYMFLLPSSYFLNIETRQIYDPLNLDFLDNFDQYKEIKTSIGPFDRIKNSLAKKRWIRSSTKVEPYLSLNYDNNAYLSLSNTFLIHSLINTKIIQIPLGDFYELWNHTQTSKYQNLNFKEKLKSMIENFHDKKNPGELLFIPSVEHFSLTKESAKNKFLEYQKFFKKASSIATNYKYSFSYQLGRVMYLDEIEEIIKHYK